MSECLKWEEFLMEVLVDQKQIDLLQEFFGYCLHDSNDFGRALAITGPPASGKSVIAGVLSSVVGIENTATFSWADIGGQFVRAELSRKRVNFFDDLRCSTRGVTYAKAFIAGDQLLASFKYKPVFEFQPACKFVLVTGVLPKTDCLALMSRFVIVKTARQLSVAEMDSDLYACLLVDKPAIVSWAEVGLERLLARGGFAVS